jgi:acylphosphatase
MENASKRIEIKIYGRVQNVGFRYAAKKKAEKLGVFCVPRNELDGSLFIKAEGESSALEKFIAWCRKGPWSAKVARVEVVYL